MASRQRRLHPFAVAATVAIATACSDTGVSAVHDDGVPRVPCGLTVWHIPKSASAKVELRGSWDAFASAKEFARTGDENDTRATHVDLEPGIYRYTIVEDGAWLPDAHRGTVANEKGREVSWVSVDRCDRPAVRVDAVTPRSAGAFSIEATFLSAADGSLLDRSSVHLVGTDGEARTATNIASKSPGIGGFTFEVSPPSKIGKYTYRLRVADASGVEAETAIVLTRERGGETFDPRDLLLYQVVTDRFRGDAGAGLPSPATPGERAGGTFRGVTSAIDDGTLDGLGVTGLWLSPVYENPAGAFPGTDGRAYTGYHGYWPKDQRAVDPRLGTEDDLRALVRKAHEHGMRVLFDVVPNHVHSENAWLTAHPDWFHGVPTCICGQGSCDWATHIQDCWFTSYLPDLDWTNDEAAQAMTANVVEWLSRFDADGVRIDAVPMAPRIASRRVAHAIRSTFDHPGHRSVLIGENFVGPGETARLRYDLGPFGLDGDFQFPLMWVLRDAFATGAAPLSAIDTAFQAGEREWEGAGATMPLFVGNHDVPRFATVAAGNVPSSGWIAAPRITAPQVFDRSRLAMAASYTLPGMAVLYYGDEVALAGGPDPDSRRTMPAGDELTADEAKLAADIGLLGRARRCSRALRRGTYRRVLADQEALAFVRETDDPKDFPVVVVLVRDATAVTLPRLDVPKGLYKDLLFPGNDASLSPELTTLATPPFSVHLLFQKDDPCAAP